MSRIPICISLLLAGALGQLTAQQYVISTYAGGPPGTMPIPALNAAIGYPQGVITDATGNVYFNASNCIFKLDSRGLLTRVAGNSYPGYSGDGGPAISAKINTDDGEPGWPAGLALDSAGNLYIADLYNYRVRKVSPDGMITTVAGNGSTGFSGDGGRATSAQFMAPAGLAIAGDGTLYVADPGNHRVRKVSPDGIVTTLAGDGRQGYSGDDVPSADAQLNGPNGLALDGAGNLFIADSGNDRVRRVSPDGIITTVAQLNFPGSIALDNAGNLYVGTRNRVRKVSAAGIITTAAGNDTAGYAGDGGPAIAAQLSLALGLAVDREGSVYISDAYDNQRLRKVSPDGIITTVAGNGTSNYGGDGGPVAQAQLNFRCCQSGGGIAVDHDGTLYIADTWNNRVRVVSAAGSIATVAGNGVPGFSGDGGPAVDAQVTLPMAVAVDNAGSLYIADTWNFRIRKISRGGIITTIAGNGTQGHSGDGGEATRAQIGYPFGVAVDASGDVYIADLGSVRKVSPAGIITTVLELSAQMGTGLALSVDSAGNVYVTDHPHERVLKISPAGVVTTVAGNGIRGYSGDGGTASNAQLAIPISLAIDSADNLLIGEWGNPRIRKVSPAGIITTIAGDGTYGYSGDGGPATSAKLGIPSGLAAGTHGEIYVADSLNAIRLLQAVSSSISVNVLANGASYYSGPIAPGELVSIGGVGLGPAQLVSAVPSSDGWYGTQLAGTTVLFNGTAAQIVFTSAMQIKTVVPDSLSSAIVQVAVGYQGQISRPISRGVVQSEPGIFTRDFDMGQAAGLNPDGSANSAANPAKAGDVISLFATGLGRSASAVNVIIGDRSTASISVDSRLAGVAQIRVKVHTGIQAGPEVPVTVQVGETSSPDVTIAVQ